MSTKLNVNIRTLLANCEELAKDEANYWRLEKFIKALDLMIDELQGYDDQQSVSKIPIYIKRLQDLKTLTNYAESPPSSPTTSLNSKSQLAGENAMSEMRQLQTAKQNFDLRKELFQDTSLRKRKTEDANSDASNENMNEAVRYFNQTQEKITEHMLAMTRNLREQTETANRIIKKDTEVVSRSAGMADRNINSLHKETKQLEGHSKNAWKCWMWMMIVFVIAVFIGTVLFMKIVKKKKI